MVEKKRLMFLGPPRSRKTTTTLKHLVSLINSGTIDRVFYISYTKRSLFETHSTLMKWIMPSSNIKINKYVFLTNKLDACPRLEEEDKDNYELCLAKHCWRCDWNHDEWNREVLENVATLDIKTLKEVSETYEVCPNKIAMSQLNKPGSFVYSTYAAFNMHKINPRDIDNAAFVFDEWRHLLDCDILYQEKLGVGNNPAILFDKYLDYVIGQVEMLKQMCGNNQWMTMLDYAIYEYIDRLCEAFEAWMLHGNKKEVKEQWKQNIYPKRRFFIAAKERLNIESLDMQRVKNALFQLRERRNLPDNLLLRVGKIIEGYSALDSVAGNQVNDSCYFNYIQIDGVLELIIRDRTQRHRLRDFIDRAKAVILADATPPSKELMKYVLGDEFSFDKYILKPPFDFKIVCTNNYKKREFFRELIDRVDILVFPKSKKEREKLKHTLKGGFNPTVYKKKLMNTYIDFGKKVSYSRSMESESVQRDEDITVNIGYPLPNIDAYRWRGEDLKWALGENEEDSISKLNHELAMQALLQQAMRTADPKKTFNGSIFLGISKKQVMKMLETYDWLEPDNFVFLDKRYTSITAKIDDILVALKTGETPISGDEDKILTALEEEGELSLLSLSKIINRRKENTKKIVDKLIDENKIQEIPKVYRGKNVINYKLTENSSFNSPSDLVE